MIEESIVLGQVYIGKQGEHLVRRVRIPEVNIWKCVYGEGVFELWHKRCGDTEPYLIELEIIKDCGYWNITLTDTAHVGEGQCELRYIVNGKVVKSQTAETTVLAFTAADPESGTTPGGSADIIGEMLEIKAEVLEAKEDIEELCENLPEKVVVDMTLDADSNNPIANCAVTNKIAEIEKNGGGNASVTDENGNFAINDNIASCKAYYIKSIDLDNKKIYLSKTKVIPVISTANNTDTSFTTPAYDIGDMFSIVNKNHYNSCGTITAVSNNVVTYSEDSLGFDAIIEDTDDGIADYTFHVHNKPEEGVVLITFNAFAIGKNNKALGACSSAEGGYNIADGFYSHVEGVNTYASYAAHAEGNGCVAVGNESHAEGHKTKASGGNSHAEGQQTIAVGGGSHAEGMSTQALGSQSHAEGMNTIAKGSQSHAEGVGTQSNAFASHTEGNGTVASAAQSHAEGYQTIASGQSSHAEGQQTEASGTFAHAQGIRTYAKGYAAFTSGADAEASGDVSVAMGKNAKALGRASFAIGESVTANKSQSVAMGMGTTADAQGQMAVGMYNEADADAMFIVGNGTASKRKNAFVVKRDGRIFANGTELGSGGGFKKIGFTADCDYIVTSNALTTFNQAVSEASEGDTILVMPGIYGNYNDSGLLTIAKTLNFVGIGKPIINFKITIGDGVTAYTSTWDNVIFNNIINCITIDDYTSARFNAVNSIFQTSTSYSMICGEFIHCELHSRKISASLSYRGDDSNDFIAYKNCKMYNCDLSGDVTRFNGCDIHEGYIPNGYALNCYDCNIYNYSGTISGSYNTYYLNCIFYGQTPTAEGSNIDFYGCHLVAGTWTQI